MEVVVVDIGVVVVSDFQWKQAVFEVVIVVDEVVTTVVDI